MAKDVIEKSRGDLMEKSIRALRKMTGGRCVEFLKLAVWAFCILGILVMIAAGVAYAFVAYNAQVINERQAFCEQFGLEYDYGDLGNHMCDCSGYGVQYGYPPATENYMDLCDEASE